MKNIIYLPILFILCSCFSKDGIINVNSKNLKLINTDGDKIHIQPGKHKISVEINPLSWKRFRRFFNHGHSNYINVNIGENDFEFGIKNEKPILYTNGPTLISEKISKQPYTLQVTRALGRNKDKYTIKFRAKKTTQAKIDFSLDHYAYSEYLDLEENNFLKSYQEVRRSQRSLVFKVDAGLDSMVMDNKIVKGTANIGDEITHFVSIATMAPWIYSRYKHVYWIRVSDDMTTERQKSIWDKAFTYGPIVDYVAWVHGGDQFLDPSWLELKKRNQLRMVYIGACDSGNSERFITEYNAAVASGHRGTSVSPLFQFSFIRNWSYGSSFKESIDDAWWLGSHRARGIGFITFADKWMSNLDIPWKNIDDLLYQSEIQISYTKEVLPSILSVEYSSSPKRTTWDQKKIISENASELKFDSEELELLP